MLNKFIEECKQSFLRSWNKIGVKTSNDYWNKRHQGKTEFHCNLLAMFEDDMYMYKQIRDN